MTMTTLMVVMVVVMVAMGVVGVQSQSGSADANAWKNGMDFTVCQDFPNSPGNKIPDLPQSFSLRVEANILKKHKTTTLHEYYDYNANIAAVRQIDAGVEQMFFYMYNSNQFLTVVPDNLGGHFCYTENLTATDNQDMFGLQPVNSTTDRIFSVLGALHFGDGINEKYLGTENVRGIPCDKWQSCQYWPEMDSTATVYWYFSDKSQWSSISGYSAPVRCHVTGIRWINQSYSYPFDHIYEFYDFTGDISGMDRHFDVPANAYCFTEKNTKPMPSPPPAYSFDSENFDMISNSITFVKEQYDNKTQLLRFDYREPPSANGPFGSRYVSQYHDYNTGVAYVIDVMKASCRTTVIAPDGFDDIVVNKNDVRLRDPDEFLDLDHYYVYQGVRTTRGIQCDTWAALRFDYPNRKINNPGTTWTWYFATEDWMRSMGFQDNFVMPVMLDIYGDNPQNPIHTQISFYEYNVDEPDFLTWDLSPCFSTSESKNYAFFLKGTYTDVVGSDLTAFKYYVLAALQIATGGASALRMAHLDVQAVEGNTLVTLELLDKAPLKGDVVRIKEEPDLNTSFNALKTAVNGGNMKILVPTGGPNGGLKPISVMPAGDAYQPALPQRQTRSAFTPPPPSKSGFSAGALGGTCAGLLVFGALLGFLIIFLVSKAKGGSLRGGDVQMQKFDNEND